MARVDAKILAAVSAPSDPPDADTARFLAMAIREAGITKRGDALAFLAQVATESGGFK